MPATETSSSPTWRHTLRRAPAVMLFAGGILLIAIHHVNGTEGDAEGMLSSVAFGAPCAMAGALAFVAHWKGAPLIAAGAGFAVIPIALVSFVLLPLLLPAAWLIGAALSAPRRGGRGEVAVSLLVAIGLVAAFVALLVHEDPSTWQTETASGSSSDIVTTTEAIISLAITSTVSIVALGWTLRPARR